MILEETDRMQKISCYQAAVINTGTYCQIVANSLIEPGAGKVLAVPNLITSATLYCVAGTGVTGGVVVPLIMTGDGSLNPAAAASTLTGAGMVFLISLNSPVKGIGIQITTAIVGGSVLLYTSALIV